MTIHADAQALLEQYARAYRVGDTDGCAAIFTDDSILYSPYAPSARGRAAIAALHRDWTAGVGHAKTLTVLQAGSSGDLGWCLAAYSGGDVTDAGTSLCVLARQPGGDWLVRICSLSADAPPLAGP